MNSRKQFHPLNNSTLLFIKLPIWNDNNAVLLANLQPIKRRFAINESLKRPLNQMDLQRVTFATYSGPKWLFMELVQLYNIAPSLSRKFRQNLTVGHFKAPQTARCFRSFFFSFIGFKRANKKERKLRNHYRSRLGLQVVGSA